MAMGRSLTRFSRTHSKGPILPPWPREGPCDHLLAVSPNHWASRSNGAIASPMSDFGFLVLCVAAGPRIDPNATNAILAGILGVSAMAVQNALVQISLKGAPSTAVMTSNVTRFAMDVGEVLLGGDSADVAKARNRATRTLPAIAGFTVGCAASDARPHLARGPWLCLSASPCSRLRWVLRPSPTIDRNDGPSRFSDTWFATNRLV